MPKLLPPRDRLLRRTVEILATAALLFLALRLAGAHATGRDILAHEERAREALRALHRAQQRRVADGLPFAPLSKILASTGEGPLAGLTVEEVPAAGGEVELARVGPYLLALHLTLEGGERVWSASDLARAPRDPTGYGAFAWPARFGRPCRWVFAVDRHGLLLGSWNPDGQFDGTRPPFPPEARPLRSYLLARKEGEDGVWYLFEELGEILTRQP